jgi:signal transduction histidine kinase
MAWRTFAARLTLVLALLLLGYGAFVMTVARSTAAQSERESLQRLSHGLAQHIVSHWPEITSSDRAAADVAARQALLNMLMVVNPGVQVYVLDAQGRVEAYVGEPGRVREHQVDLGAVRAFLAGAPLPLTGTDPMGSGRPRIFSAAMFPPRPGDTQPPGYLYVVLDGGEREQVAGSVGERRAWQGAGVVGAAGLLVTLLIGVLVLRRLTLPLQRLATRIHAYSAAGIAKPTPIARDEIQAIDRAFDEMTQRIESQATREREQSAAHRETMAGVAHDLRTPLTALHGQLEALGGPTANDPAARQRVWQAAMAQSNKVRRLSQQLFELAALQSSDQVMHCERFRLDELVNDAVQKFDVASRTPRVTLSGNSPGRLELDGDLHLIERAVTNLIDNALRHAPGEGPVCVSVQHEGGQVQVVVEDHGPGLPEDLSRRLAQGASLRDPPARRAGGGIGGLGLAIAQRVAQLHGGTLRTLPAPQGGTRMCLVLPLTR